MAPFIEGYGQEKVVCALIGLGNTDSEVRYGLEPAEGPEEACQKLFLGAGTHILLPLLDGLAGALVGCGRVAHRVPHVLQPVQDGLPLGRQGLLLLVQVLQCREPLGIVREEHRTLTAATRFPANHAARWLDNSTVSMLIN